MNFCEPILVLFVILKVVSVECHYLTASDPNAFACNGDRNATLVECPLTCMRTCYNALDTPGPCLRDCTGAGCECHPGFVLDVRRLKCVLPKDCSDPPVVSCRTDEVFALCGACPRTCHTLREYPPRCEFPCAWHACVCAQGLVRDAFGRCIPPDLCPLGIPPGSSNPCGTNEEYSQCGSACPVTCSNMEAGFFDCAPYCVAGCTCQFGYVRNSQNRCVSPSLCEVPPKCKPLEVWSLCAGCPVSCALLRLSPALRPECVSPCNTRGCMCEPGLVRSDAGECVLPTMCDHFAGTSPLENTNGEKKYFDHHVIQVKEDLPEGENKKSVRNREIKRKNVQHTDFGKSLAQDSGYEKNNPIISIAEPIPASVAENLEQKKEKQNPTNIPILKDALEKQRDESIMKESVEPLSSELLAAGTNKDKERKLEEDNTQPADTGNSSNLDNREWSIPNIELSIPLNIDSNDNQEDLMLDPKSEEEKEEDKIWSLSLLVENNTHGETSNEVQSMNDNVQYIEKTISPSEKNTDNVQDSDIVWNFSSPNDVYENSKILEENKTNTTSIEGHFTEDNVQHADLNISDQQYESTLDNSSNIPVDESVIPDMKINDDTGDESLIDEETISPLYPNSGSDLEHDTTRSEDSSKEMNQHESNYDTYKTNEENDNKPTITDENENTREGSPLSYKQISLDTDENQTGDTELNADNVQHADQTNLGSQHDGIDDESKDSIDESKNETDYDQNIDGKNIDGSSTDSNSVVNDSISKYVSPSLDDMNTPFDDIALCADDSKLCCYCCDNTECTSIEICEPEEDNAEFSSLDTYLPDRVVSIEDQGDKPVGLNPKIAENTSYQEDWKKEGTKADYLYYSEQPVSCNGDPNALPGCGNYCGRTCNDYFIDDLECSNHTCRVGACDCKNGFVLDVNSNKCVLPDDCTECGSNEYLDHCPSDCHITCPNDTEEEAQPCPKETDCLEPACVCMFNYRRDSNDECVPIQQCPNLQCKGAHEYYEPCPPADYNEKCKAPKSHPRHQTGPSRDIHECRPACLCADGYCRNIYGYCVSEVDNC